MSTLPGTLELRPFVSIPGGSGEDRVAERSGEEKMGWMLDDRPVGELGREYDGGGVADMARGEE